jgi:hypothetical protein
MGYMHTRRYLINLSEDEMLRVASEYAEEPVTDLVTASMVITSAADVGNLTDICIVLDEYVVQASTTSGYFAHNTTTTDDNTQEGQ